MKEVHRHAMTEQEWTQRRTSCVGRMPCGCFSQRQARRTLLRTGGSAIASTLRRLLVLTVEFCETDITSWKRYQDTSP